MQEANKNFGFYLQEAREQSLEEFLAACPFSVLVEQAVLDAAGKSQLLSGTVLIHDLQRTSTIKLPGSRPVLHTAKVFALRKRPGSFGKDVFVGRAPTNDIIIPDRAVSKSHAHFSPGEEAGEFFLVDMFSSNGTFLNGKKLHPFERHKVSDGDEIRFGPDYTVIYYTSSGFYQMLQELNE